MPFTHEGSFRDQGDENRKAVISVQTTGTRLTYRDLKSVENYLLSLGDVIDASTWMDCGEICAHLTVYPEALLTESTVATLFERNFGTGCKLKSVSIVREGLLQGFALKLAA